MKKKLKILSVILSAMIFIFSSCVGNNTQVVTDTEKYPQFSPIGGFFKEAQTVSISCENASKIYYTTDTSLPTEESTLYTNPFELDKQCIVRAMAVFPDGTTHYSMTAFDFDLNRTTDSISHMPSPNWQDQIIYFVMTDRFANGDTSNDKQNITYDDGKEYDETVPLKGQNVSGYNGGDFKGLQEKLDYIQALGATAIWATPPIKNQVSEGAYHGFHGYWASDFTQVDPHNGSLEDYQNFVKAAHDRGMYVIQDIVVNHTGDYQKGNSVITEDMLKQNVITSSDFSLNENSVLMCKPESEWKHPEQLPWKFNDVTKYTVDEFKNNAFYHFNPCIDNFVDPNQTYTYQESGLDDINTNNEVVRRLLAGYFRYWIDKVDVDGYRIDTALYVEPDFFEGFINGTEAGNEGVRYYASTLGKNDFIDFGEAWTSLESTTAGYTKSVKGAKRMDSVIYFPLEMAIRDSVSGNGGTSTISNILRNRSKVGYDNPDRLVTFIDNHDVERILTIADTEMVKAAYALIMSIPGIPQFYYGVEQGFTTTRKAMFKGGYSHDEGNTRIVNDQDYYNQSGEWWDFVKNLISLRKENRVFRYNSLRILQDSENNPGILAIGFQGTNENGKAMSGAGARALFVMNTSDSEQLLNCVPDYPASNNLKAGDRLVKQTPSSDAMENELLVKAATGATGVSVSTVQMLVPAKSYAIYLLEEEGVDVSDTEHSVKIISEYNEQIAGNEIDINFVASDSGLVKVVFNNDYENAQVFTIDSTNLITQDEEGNELELPYYNLKADIGNLSNGTSAVCVELTTSDSTVIYSKAVKFPIMRPFVSREDLSITDPEGDTTGPEGYSYSVPYGFEGPQDILGVNVALSGKDIKLSVKMKQISRVWNPSSNLYDHVGFNLFIYDPNASFAPCAVQPQHNYTLPEGMKWNYWFRAYGWSSAFYTSEGADESSRGTSRSNSPYTNVVWPEDVTVKYLEGDEAIVEIYILSGALGNIKDINGLKLYINTYDMDFDQLRGLVSGAEFNPEAYSFGTADADPMTSPKVIDETKVITITTE